MEDHSNGSLGAVTPVGASALAFSASVNAATFLAGLVCNALVVATILRTPALLASSINRAVLSLCLADLVCVLVEIPLASYAVVRNFTGNQVSPTICTAQALSHGLSHSVQMMAFPVIGVERYFSISQPFEKQNHQRRVNILILFVWLLGGSIAMLSVCKFPVTTVSFFCMEDLDLPESLRQLLLKTYFILFPFGILCLAITVGSYSLIIWRVRRQQHKKAAIACLSAKLRKTKPKKRAQSCTGPCGVDALTPMPSKACANLERKLFSRRTSLPAHQRRRRKLNEIEMEELGAGAAASKADAGRPQLQKQFAVCVDDEDGPQDPILPRRSAPQRVSSTSSGQFLAPPSVAGARWMSEESSVSSVNTVERTRVTTAANSIEEDGSTVSIMAENRRPLNGEEEDGVAGGGAVSLLAQMAAPVIAISLPDQLSRCQTPARRAPSTPARQLLMRRCKSATAPGDDLSLEGLNSALSTSQRRLNHGHSLMSVFRASQRALSVRAADRKNRELKKRRSEVNIAKKSGFIVLAFLLLWLPLPITVAAGVNFLRPERRDDVRAYLNVQLCAYCFGLLTAVTNPIIYALAIRSFRVVFCKLARRRWNKISHWARWGRRGRN